MLCTTRARRFCTPGHYCVAKGLNVAKKDGFVTRGSNNWKRALERFTQDAQSDLHRDSLLKVEFLSHDSVNTLLNKQAMAEQKQHQHQLLMQLSSLYFLPRQGLAVRGHDDLEGNLLELPRLRIN